MTARHLRALGRLFAFEVHRALGYSATRDVPMQSKAGVFVELEALGLVEKVAVDLGGWPPMTVHGWRLTTAGRYAYCASCDSEAL